MQNMGRFHSDDDPESKFILEKLLSSKKEEQAEEPIRNQDSALTKILDNPKNSLPKKTFELRSASEIRALDALKIGSGAFLTLGGAVFAVSVLPLTLLGAGIGAMVGLSLQNKLSDRGALKGALVGSLMTTGVAFAGIELMLQGLEKNTPAQSQNGKISTHKPKEKVSPENDQGVKLLLDAKLQGTKELKTFDVQLKNEEVLFQYKKDNSGSLILQNVKTHEFLTIPKYYGELSGQGAELFFNGEVIIQKQIPDDFLMAIKVLVKKPSSSIPQTEIEARINEDITSFRDKSRMGINSAQSILEKKHEFKKMIENNPAISQKFKAIQLKRLEKFTEDSFTSKIVNYRKLIVQGNETYADVHSKKKLIKKSLKESDAISDEFRRRALADLKLFQSDFKLSGAIGEENLNRSYAQAVKMIENSIVFFEFLNNLPDNMRTEFPKDETTVPDYRRALEKIETVMLSDKLSNRELQDLSPAKSSLVKQLTEAEEKQLSKQQKITTAMKSELIFNLRGHGRFDTQQKPALNKLEKLLLSQNSPKDAEDISRAINTIKVNLQPDLEGETAPTKEEVSNAYNLLNKYVNKS
jgi:hypothetical protein